MALKKIRHAIFEWFDPDGTRHYAFRGDVVDVPDHVVEAFDHLGPFYDDDADDDADSDLDDQGQGGDDEGDDQDQGGDGDPDGNLDSDDDAEDGQNDQPPAVGDDVEVVQPAKTAPVKAWREYAVAKGFDPVEAAELTRPELIAALS
ncbi:hypothetical protein [Gordonia soli]|uniref:Uncharacterized protein n=1 Tax=Gordonia soli NBRC 108243 TaxID=1223545 RepID=M0QS30_9ACTN|nr:hypothetical protein [Gordonia soli]GAC70732.1 hypothetical protein GS4_39_00630 [Gordonia soli NBRC 108243]